jgi:putative ABC transport system permease protein
MIWWQRLMKRQEMERNLDAELRFHFDGLVADNLRDGMSETEARRSARLQFGGIEQVKEECRDARGMVFIADLFRDLRYAGRSLRGSPGFTFTAIATLAIGIGVNAAVFTLMNTVLFKGFPLVEKNDRILYISGQSGISYPDFQDWRAQAKSFEDLAIVADLPVSLNDESGFTESYDATRVSANAFKLVGQAPLIGRDFAPTDESPGAAPAAILSYGFWDRRFGKDSTIVGRTVRMNGAATTIIGVMPRGFTFPERQDLWVPLVPNPDLQKRDTRTLWFAFGRLREGVTLEKARAELETIGKRLQSAYPITNQGYLPRAMTFTENFIGPNASTIYRAMWGAVGFVLLIACANLANLTLARALARSREISLRMALGAGRRRIVRQLLVESLLLSGLGGFLGWWIAKCGVWTYELIADPPSYFDHVLDYTMDYRVLAYFIAISLCTGLLFGLAPAIRLSKLDVNAVLKDGGRGAIGGGRRRHLSALLVIAEMALAVVLLAGAGVMIRSFLNIYTADLGVKTDNVLTMLLKPPDAKYSTLEAQTAFFDRLTTRLEAIPGIESIALADSLPSYSTRRLPYELAGAPPAGYEQNEERRPKLSAVVVSPSYFRTLGAVMRSGREFTDADRLSANPVVIVNQHLASKFWPGEDAVGKHLRLFNGKAPEAWLTVVGVVSNIVQFGRTRPELDTLVYLPYRQKKAPFMNVFARTRVPPVSLGTAIRHEVQAIDPDLPISYYMPLAERVSWGYALSRSIAVLFLIFAVIALLLASVGLYTVIANSVAQRTQEIGIRMAIGATASGILKLVFKQGMLPLGIGLTLGLAASFAVIPILKSALVQVSPADPITFIIASVVLILAAMLGCLIPARRAIRINPQDALRWE